MYRKLSLILLAIIIVAVAVLFSTPYFLKDRVTDSIESYIYGKFDYEVAFSSRLSLTKHFPNLSFTLEDVIVTNKNNIIAQAEHIDVVIGFLSIINSKVLRYKEVDVGGGYINYPYSISGVEAQLYQIDLSLKGDMAEEIFPAKINIEVGELFLTKDSVVYIDGATLSSELEAEIDTKNRRAVLGDNLIDINGLDLILEGEIGYSNSGIDLDVIFKTGEEEMPVLIGALVPSAFLSQFKGNGLVSVDGSVVGQFWEPQGIDPKVLLKVDLKDGGLSYIDNQGDLLEFTATGALDIHPKADSIKIKYSFDDLVVNGIGATDVNGLCLVSDHSISVDSCTFGIFGGFVSVDGLLEMEHEENPSLSAKIEFNEVDLAASMAGIPALRSFFPTEQEINGKIALLVDFEGMLGKNLSLIPESVIGNGRLVSDSIMVEGSVVFENMKKILQLGDNYTSTFHGIDIKFSVASGKMVIEPFTTTVGNLKMTVSGNHTLDNTLNYLVKTDMPRSDLGSPINSLINLFSGSLSAFGLNVPIEESIKMEIKITGSFDKPVITPLF